MPTWSIVPSRIWKAQVAYLARHFRVVTFDGRGSGASGRPRGAAAYTDEEYAADTVAVMDAAGVDRAVLVSLSCGAPGRCTSRPATPTGCSGLFAIAPACGFRPSTRTREESSGPSATRTPGGWAKYNKHYWLEGGYDDFLRVLLRPDVQRAALDQADRGRRGVGPRHRPADPGRHDRRAARAATARSARDIEPLCAAGPLPGHGAARHRRPGPRPTGSASGSPSSPAARWCCVEGAGHGPARPRPGAGQPRDPRVRRAVRPAAGEAAGPHLGAGPHAGAARALPVLTDRPRARPPRRGGRRRAARAATPTSRSTGSPRTRSPGCSPHARRARPPGVAPPGQRVRPRRARVRASTTCTRSSAIRRMDEILVNNFMVFDELVEARALRPRHRRRGLGRRLLPAREPASSSGRRTPGSPTSSAGCRCPTAARRRPR